MEPIIALTIPFCVYAAGELTIQKTKAIFSIALGVAILLLVGLWSGILPRSVIEDAQVIGLSNVIAGIFIVSLGTTIDFPELRRQQKVVVTSLVCVVGATPAIILTGYPLIGKEVTLSVVPIFAGGSAATLIMTTALDEMDLVIASTLCIVMYVVQKLIGVSIASLLLWRTAVRLRDNPALVAEYSQQQETVAGSRRGLPQLLASFTRPSVCLAELGLVAVVAHFLPELTGGVIHYFVLCLMMGAVFFALGLLEKDTMSKTQSGGPITFFVTILIFSNLATIAPRQVLSVLPALLSSAACGMVGTVPLSFICAKVMSFPFGLAVSFGISCTFGFPTTMLIPQEATEAPGRAETEKAAILNYLLSKILTAGSVTVTIVLVLIAGVVVRMLQLIETANKVQWYEVKQVM